MEQKNRTLKMFSFRTWCTEKPFGYRVVHTFDTFLFLVQESYVLVYCVLFILYFKFRVDM